MPTEQFYIVDRIKEEQAVLLDDEGHAMSVTLDQIPSGASRGSVLRVTLTADRAPDWSSAQIDEAETEKRRRQSGEILKKLEEGEAEIGG